MESKEKVNKKGGQNRALGYAIYGFDEDTGEEHAIYTSYEKDGSVNRYENNTMVFGTCSP